MNKLLIELNELKDEGETIVEGASDGRSINGMTPDRKINNESNWPSCFVEVVSLQENYKVMESMNTINEFNDIFETVN